MRHHNSSNPYRKVDDKVVAHLVALACSPDPDGHDHWTLRALAGNAVEFGLVESLSHETVRLPLKHTLKPWRKQQWCIRMVSGEFMAAMEDVLDLYAEPNGPQWPVVCFDDTSAELLAETRAKLPTRPGRPRLVDEAYPDVPVIRVVLDNSNTHRMASLYETFPAAEARLIVKRLEFQHTPKHCISFNMADIEFSVLARGCLHGRNADRDSLERTVSACVSERNETGTAIKQRFTAQDARRKLHRLYHCHPRFGPVLGRVCKLAKRVKSTLSSKVEASQTGR